jgi:addiction module RelE/StbE family toxin
MEVKYQICYIEEVVRKHIPNLSSSMRKTIMHAIESRLMLDPIRFGKPLQYSLKGHRRLRVGDYRIVYRIEEDAPTVIVIAIKHRKDIYNS